MKVTLEEGLSAFEPTLAIRMSVLTARFLLLSFEAEF
jgi:hypothetical protein